VSPYPQRLQINGFDGVRDQSLSAGGRGQTTCFPVELAGRSILET
jgi:hypothetical protein